MVLGQSAPFTGAAVQLGLQFHLGAQAYFDTVNAKGGVNGRTIEIKRLDDGNDDGDFVLLDRRQQKVINVMRGAVTKDRRVSLADWIKAQGGIDDVGGDLAAMGFGTIKGIAKKGQRKLIRSSGTQEGQGALLGADGQQSTNTPDELALRAMEAGYFPAGERPSINDLFAALENEARGESVYRVDDLGPERIQAAADELGSILRAAGLDPATATDAEIKSAVDAYQAAH
ncbi:MAG: hypothetical protein B7Z52_07895, partial [Burkholderiales bacterium 12-64-5]